MSNEERPEGSKEERKRRKRRGKVFVKPERCKGCGYCVEFCPSHVLALSETFNQKGYHPPEVVDADACTGCGLCGMYCPDFAIFGVRAKKAKKDSPTENAA
jgi:2-oxoglutarate ferredoxin oxidoreductase subunit delta